MTREQTRLYALARIAVPSSCRLRTFGEPTTGGHVIYTLEVTSTYDASPIRAKALTRHFGVHSETLRNPAITDTALIHDIRRAVNRV